MAINVKKLMILNNFYLSVHGGGRKAKSGK